LVYGLHYLRAKGGCHENQNESEGWPASSLNNSVKCRGKRKRDYQVQRGKESSHEDQDQREGRHPAVCVIVNRHATRVRSSEHQPQDNPKAALARRLSSFPYYDMSLGRSRPFRRNSLRENSWHLRKLRNNVRIMRKTLPALGTLFPSVRQGVLTATLTRPEKWWYLSELAEFLHTRPSSLQRELSWLEQSGILQQRKDGHRTYFKAETGSPIFGNQSDCLFEDAPQFPEEHSGLSRFAGERRFEGLPRNPRVT